MLSLTAIYIYNQLKLILTEDARQLEHLSLYQRLKSLALILFQYCADEIRSPPPPLSNSDTGTRTVLPTHESVHPGNGTLQHVICLCDAAFPCVFVVVAAAVIVDDDDVDVVVFVQFRGYFER